MQLMYGKYTGDKAIFYTRMFPNNIRANLYKAKEFVCDYVCKSRKGCPPVQTEPVDIFGWSRGGVAALTLAKRLKDDGCKCEDGTIKPVKIRFMGLIDPVATGGLQMLFTNSSVVPSNVATVYIAYAGKHTFWGSLFFQASHPAPEDPKATGASEATFDYVHERIGWGSASDVQDAIESAAHAAGAPIPK